jgi:hypothetical protein
MNTCPITHSATRVGAATWVPIIDAVGKKIRLLIPSNTTPISRLVDVRQLMKWEVHPMDVRRTLRSPSIIMVMKFFTFPLQLKTVLIRLSFLMRRMRL